MHTRYVSLILISVLHIQHETYKLLTTLISQINITLGHEVYFAIKKAQLELKKAQLEHVELAPPVYNLLKG